MSEERRLFRRKLVNARVLLMHPDIGELETYTYDVSNGGALVLLKSLPNLPVGTLMRMRMVDSENSEIVFRMELARTDAKGFGLKFLGFEKNNELYPMSDLKKELKK